MEQIINVQGMTCLNCEKTVKQKLEAIEGIDTIEVNFKEAYAQFQTSNPLPIEKIDLNFCFCFWYVDSARFI